MARYTPSIISQQSFLQSSPGYSTSFGITSSGNPNTALIFFTCMFGSPATGSTMDVTYGGGGLTQVIFDKRDSSGNIRCNFHYVLEPPAGTYTLSINSSQSRRKQAFSIELANVDSYLMSNAVNNTTGGIPIGPTLTLGSLLIACGWRAQSNVLPTLSNWTAGESRVDNPVDTSYRLATKWVYTMAQSASQTASGTVSVGIAGELLGTEIPVIEDEDDLSICWFM